MQNGERSLPTLIFHVTSHVTEFSTGENYIPLRARKIMSVIYLTSLDLESLWMPG